MLLEQVIRAIAEMIVEQEYEMFDDMVALAATL